MSEDNSAPSAGNSMGQGRKMPVGRPFQKGQSGNPDGAPKWLKQARESLKSLSPLARKTLRAVMKGSAKDSDKVRAAEVVLKYTMPPPTQRHSVKTDGKDPLLTLTPEQLVAFVKGEKS